jgi:UDP:flavonoid glycosyltransferase YjiC (YdhE family)
MKVLIAAAGSHGDVLPFLALARAFAARGHEARLYASAYFSDAARSAGVSLHALGTSEDHEQILRDPDLAHPLRGHDAIARALVRHLPELDRALAADIEPGRTLLVGSTLAFATRLRQEVDGVPCVTVHLSPATLRARQDTPRLGARDYFAALPVALQPLAWWAIDRLALDPIYARALNGYRAQLGLRPVHRLFDRWLHSADLVLAMFPPWFAPAQGDWPSNLVQTGFPLYDAPGGPVGLPPTAERFLRAGPAPIAYTAGTATATERRFFMQSIEACRLAGRRGILLTHRPEQLPESLPPGVEHFAYLPFSALLPRVGALVHHGGIGTTSQALAAAVPQIVRPLAYDQFDTSRRLERLGVGLEILPRDYRPAVVAQALERLGADVALQERARDCARRLAGSDAVGTSCAVILERFLPAMRERAAAKS